MEGQHEEELDSVDLLIYEGNSITQHVMINEINSQSSSNHINRISIQTSDLQSNSKQIISSDLDSKTSHINSQQCSSLKHQRHRHQPKVDWSPRGRRTSRRDTRSGSLRWFTTTT